MWSEGVFLVCAAFWRHSRSGKLFSTGREGREQARPRITLRHCSTSHHWVELTGLGAWGLLLEEEGLVGALLSWKWRGFILNAAGSMAIGNEFFFIIYFQNAFPRIIRHSSFLSRSRQSQLAVNGLE
uniref:Putative secreted protein n=1 Tax=Anopheles marajoara TaxID=58244 RepID=A0A2M4C813_9DIPT